MHQLSETPEFSDQLYAKTVFDLVGNRFIYVKQEDNQYVLYSCTNNGRWERGEQHMQSYIRNDLYNHFRDNAFSVTDAVMKSLRSLKEISSVRAIMEEYKSLGRTEVEFDTNRNLLGFSNGVYDLGTCQFREYLPEDYITMSTGYDFIEPSIEEVQKVESIISMIMPIPEEREVYMTMMSTAISGQRPGKFYILNGPGGNGKTFMNHFVLNALGKYGIMTNTAILTESDTRTIGVACPERAGMHKKRLVIFPEPSRKAKLRRTVIKDLTEHDTFKARNLYSKKTVQDMYGTLILETTGPMLFTENVPVNVQEIPFRATFTDNAAEWNDSQYIYKVDRSLTSDEFRHSHRCALIKVLSGVNYSVSHPLRYDSTMGAELSVIVT